MKNRLSIILLFLSFNIQAQSEQFSIHQKRIDSEHLIEYNFDTERYAIYQKAFNDSLVSFFKLWNKGQEVKIIQTLDPNLYPYYAFTAKPAFTDSIRHALQKKLMHIAPITSKFISFSTEFTIVINNGATKRGAQYSPVLKTPLEVKRGAYEYGSFVQKHALIKSWLVDGAIPILIAVLKDEAKELIALQAFVNSIESQASFKEPFPVYSSTALNYNYWGSFEELRHNPNLLPIYKTFLLAAQGQFEYAQIYMQMIYQFENEHTLLHYLLDELLWRMAYYFSAEKSELTTINGLKKAGDTHSANLLMDSLLNTNPMSTAGLLASLNPKMSYLVSTYPFTQIRHDLYFSNPMLVYQLKPVSKKEAYQNYLRRLTNDLFVDAETYTNDFETYAEMALELNAYDFAANLYWMMEASATDDSQNAYLFNYNYALNKMEMKLPIVKKTKKQFKKTDKKLRKKMKKNSAYKTFKIN